MSCQSHQPMVRCSDVQPTHRTAGAVVVVDGRVLLEERSADALVYPGCWDTPGGHVEAGEDPEQALVREVREELSILIEECFLGAVQDDRMQERTAGRVYRHYVYVVRRFRGIPDARLHQTLEWWPVDKLLAAGTPNLNPLMVESVRRFVAAGWI